VNDGLTVGVDARLRAAEDGVGSFVIGLASGLAAARGADSFVFLTLPGLNGWLRPYLGANGRLISIAQPGWRRALRARAPYLAALWRAARSAGGARPRVPRSDGTLEASGVDVIHLTSQSGFLTDVPTIYHPHDLQHLHFPHYFSKAVIAQRELFYRTLCDQASVVAVASNWVKRDLIEHYGLAANRIQVVPLAPPLSEYPEPRSSQLEATCEKYHLPREGYAFFPSRTWPHKNHLGLLEALSILRRSGMTVPLVCSGRLTPFAHRISARARELGLEHQVRFLGLVDPVELRCLYQMSRCVVLPTRFEAASFPMWEAFLARVPCGCAAVTSLPEQAGGAALLFDPDQPESIAGALRTLWTDEAVRDELALKGSENVSRLSWERTAEIFGILYRRAAGRPLNASESSVLADADRFM
jgi:glycosyltransferase involved in cell wall biosynthesis